METLSSFTKKYTFLLLVLSSVFSFTKANAQITTNPDEVPVVEDPYADFKMRLEKRDVTKCNPDDGYAWIFVSGGIRPYKCWLITASGQIRIPEEGKPSIFERKLAKGKHLIIVEDFFGARIEGWINIKLDKKIACLDTVVNRHNNH